MTARPRLGLVAGGVLLGALCLVAAPAVADWTDTATVTGTTITAATVPAPVLACGGLSLGSVQFNWPAVAGATGYTVTFIDSTGTASASYDTTGTSFAATSGALITSGTARVRAKVPYGGGATTWISGPSNVRNYSAVAGLVGLCS
ncbi:hypothetical protein [Nocardioides lianchengensis]|uniref:Fibronectin type-III domain-containing protein n=1 Tax=Nocardioides lianchengensis TaxID=1045774 RepID=A0A1G6YEN9_9ACTN|nr:hypothetical protein [Nocardioides lianchengensis]NYG09671.1 hypothetical protein [Nocardioides lianchengensis]SDD88944.1 hypothetical protein SAMN05421872_11222 [Nocardioides lianchengensis]